MWWISTYLGPLQRPTMEIFAKIVAEFWKKTNSFSMVLWKVVVLTNVLRNSLNRCFVKIFLGMFSLVKTNFSFLTVHYKKIETFHWSKPLEKWFVGTHNKRDLEISLSWLCWKTFNSSIAFEVLTAQLQFYLKLETSQPTC